MPRPSELLAVTVDDASVMLDELMRHALWREQAGFLDAAVDAALIRGAAERMGLGVSDEELQEAADAFREARGLHEAEAVERWLSARRLTVEGWEACLEGDVIAAKVRGAVTGPHVARHFAENRLALDRVGVSRILVAEEGVARELRAQVVEEEADFHALARRYSSDEGTRLAGGYMGVVRMADLEPRLQAAAFGAQPGQVAGPVKVDGGWCLLKVEAFHPAALDDATREAIAAGLFEEWLGEERRRARVAVPLLEGDDD